ncbi:MAG: glycosyltransferase [Mycobacterium sp.]|nr:glycosyltransferase [Mycobacterium sp.]
MTARSTLDRIERGRLRERSWNGLVVYVADTAWDGNQFVSQHVASRLAERAPVLYVDPPLSRVSAMRRPALAPSLREARLRMVRPQLARLTPLVPPGLSRPVMRDITTTLVRRMIKQAVDVLAARPKAMISGSVLPVFDAVEADRKVFYATDDFAMGANLMGLDGDWVHRQVQRQLASADCVLTVSEQFAEKCRKQRIEPVLVPNGCDVRFFSNVDNATPPSDVELPGPIAGFVGHLSSRIDLRCLEAVADRGISLLLVGPRQLTFDAARVEPLLARPNVQWVGAKPFADLPSYLRAIDVGLVPYADTEFNRASFPLKTLEYLAAGRDVVSTDLPATRWLDTPLITISSTAAEFAAAVDVALATPSSAELRATRRAFAEQHSWERRVDQIADVLGLTT